MSKRDSDSRLRSTGPRSEAGKQISCQNSRKHGLFSGHLHFKSPEDRQEYEDLYLGLVRSQQPEGEVQERLVDEIALCYWKMRESLIWEERVTHLQASDRTADTVRRFLKNGRSLQVPLPGLITRVSEEVFPFPFKEMVLRLGNDQQDQGHFTDPTASNRVDDRDTDRFAVELHMGDPMAAVDRAESKWRRRLYTALNELSRPQALESSHQKRNGHARPTQREPKTDKS